MIHYYKRVYANKVDYKGITFNSTLEGDFANFLDGKEVKHKKFREAHLITWWRLEDEQPKEQAE